MAWIKVPKGWELPEREATSEYVYLNRRKFMASVGRGAVGAVGLLAGCGYQRIFEPLSPLPGPAAPPQEEPPQHPVDEGPPPPLYPATLNPAFSELDRALTEEAVTSYWEPLWRYSAATAVSGPGVAREDCVIKDLIP